MLTLGIETSCDETSCSILEGSDIIKSNIVSSSLFQHQPFGGVVPEIASRHCLEQIDFVFNQALKQAKVKAEDIELIAVTQGPGLIGSLLVGVCFAKALSYQLGVPLVAVNHLEAHLEAAFISNDGKFIDKAKSRPEKYIGLLVSGGHTSLTYHDSTRMTMLGQTVDDAVGEAYDKTAKILGLGYPGGPILDRLAKEGNKDLVKFTNPKLKNRFDFSFSGVKTAVLYYVRDRERKITLEEKAQMDKDVAASFQSDVVDWLVRKALDAAEYKKVSDIVVGGGVSANSALREALMKRGEKAGVNAWFPHLSLTGDNAAMIARRGYDCFKQGKTAGLELSGNPNLQVA